MILWGEIRCLSLLGSKDPHSAAKGNIVNPLWQEVLKKYNSTFFLKTVQQKAQNLFEFKSNPAMQ